MHAWCWRLLSIVSKVAIKVLMLSRVSNWSLRSWCYAQNSVESGPCCESRPLPIRGPNNETLSVDHMSFSNYAYMLIEKADLCLANTCTCFNFRSADAFQMCQEVHFYSNPLSHPHPQFYLCIAVWSHAFGHISLHTRACMNVLMLLYMYTTMHVYAHVQKQLFVLWPQAQAWRRNRWYAQLGMHKCSFM